MELEADHGEGDHGFGGHRQPNAALHRVVVVRMHTHQPAPSTCSLRAERAGKLRTMRAGTSGCRSNPADFRPHLERPHPCGSVFTGGDVVAAEMEEVGDLVVGGEKALCLLR